MDKARYYVALFSIVMYPPAVAAWFLLHPFLGVWRRVGPGVTYAVTMPVLIAMMAVLYLMRLVLLDVEFGTSWLLAVPGAALLVVGMRLDVLRARALGIRAVLGIPELKGEREPGSLVQAGPYRWVRHPRYVASMIGVVGIALFANHLATYVLIPVMALGLYLVAVLEERELVERFGDAYREYQRRVPRFIPSFQHRP
ncbi:MAG: isoprenylcysteine carboxylmethyltransferase family protein [Gemmatimonadetes bacterium]|nr:isoprenylcysteine carboxylmethyltransferase family protein [Gemmatimonadota bacterium]